MRRVALALLCLAACGGDDGVRHIIDAPPQAIDGPPGVDAGPVPVTITISRDGVPQSGVHVYFQNADSSVVLATTTDPTGTASASMDAGGYVTALNAFPQDLGPQILIADEVDTYAGVKPGDHLLLSRTSYDAENNVTFTVPFMAGAADYAIATTCNLPLDEPPILNITRLFADGSGDPPSGVISLFNCTGPTDVLVAAENVNGTPLAYFYVSAQTFTAGEMVDYSGQDYSVPASRGYTYTDVPGTIPFVTTYDLSLSAHGALYQSYAGNSAGTTTITGSLPVPTFNGASDLVETDLDTNEIAVQHFIDWGPYATTYTTDVGARLLPSYTGGPYTDTAAHVVSWTEDTGGVTPDFSLIDVVGFRQSDSHSWDWRMVSPRTGTSVKFPTLPIDVYDYNFQAADTEDVEGVVIAKLTGGYDVARPLALSLFGPAGFVSTSSSGTLTYEDGISTQNAQPAFRGHKSKRRSTHRLTHRHL